MLCRFVCIGRKVLGKKSDQDAGEKSGENRKINTDKVFSKDKPYDRECDHCNQERTCICSSPERFQQCALVRALSRLYEKRSKNRCQDTDRRKEHRDRDRICTVNRLYLVKCNDSE